MRRGGRGAVEPNAGKIALAAADCEAGLLQVNTRCFPIEAQGAVLTLDVRKAEAELKPFEKLNQKDKPPRPSRFG